MNDEVLVSVIIPVYNVQLYLKRCVKSVVEQTIKSIEIILVDDGSTDASGKMCDDLALEDRRIKVIHKKNGGLSSARNAGMKIAEGKYIFFLDSDDWLEKDGLETLANTAEKYDVDFVRYKAIRSNWPGLAQNAPCDVEKIRELKGGFYNHDRIVQEVYPRLFSTSEMTMGAIVGAWESLYKHSFLNTNHIFFKEDVRYSEDVVFSADVGKHCHSFYYIEKAGIYHYFYNPNSISKSFRPGRWNSAKKIFEYLNFIFKNDDSFDFTDELIYAQWFLIFQGLGERRYISDKKKKIEYVRNILHDQMTVSAPLSLSKFTVSWKQKVLMIAVKLKLTDFICRV